MFRKIFALATLLCALPALANAWNLTTWAKSQGGGITSNNVVGTQTVVNGSVTRGYSSASEAVTVTPNTGWKISKLEINGIVQTTIPAMPITAANGGIQKVFATFARLAYTVGATAGGNGTVDKSNYSPVYAGYQSPAKSFVFTPSPGHAVTDITATAGTQDVDYQFLNAVTGVPVTLPAAVGVKVKVNVVNVPNTSMAFSAAFAGSLPPVVNPPTAATAAQLAKTQCANCHATQGVGAAVYGNWSSSRHKSGSVLCYGCHVGANAGGHPGAAVTSATCESCHNATLSATTHPAALTAAKCLSCHDSHNPASGIAALQPTNHPAVTLYTFEEIGMQMAGGAKVPVQVDATGKGMPYSPKQTCGTSGCHVKSGVDYTYDKIADHAFHSAQGRNEYVDSSDGKFDATKTKPFTQSGAMVGKW